MCSRSQLRILMISSLTFMIACCTDRITPVDMTYTAIGETFYRIHMYAQSNSTIPQSLDALPRRPGYLNRTTDGWDRPLEFIVGTDGTITLRSYGRDGQPGGDGEDRDISRTYRTKRSDGSFWAAEELWVVEGQVR